MTWSRFAVVVQHDQRHPRQAAGWSQTDLAGSLACRGLPFQQTTILKVEKGTRPLRLEEAVAIAETLGVSIGALTQYVEDDVAAEAVTMIEETNVAMARLNRQRMDSLEQERAHADQVERLRELRRKAYDRLRMAGGRQDDEGRWWWQNKALAFDYDAAATWEPEEHGER